MFYLSYCIVLYHGIEENTLGETLSKNIILLFDRLVGSSCTTRMKCRELPDGSSGEFSQ